MTTILDTRDTIVIGGVTVIVWPHPSGDSCATRRYVMRLHRSGVDPWQLLAQAERASALPTPYREELS